MSRSFSRRAMRSMQDALAAYDHARGEYRRLIQESDVDQANLVP